MSIGYFEFANSRNGKHILKLNDIAIREEARKAIIGSYTYDLIENALSKRNPIRLVIIENQLALNDQIVVETLARLIRQGLDRHDAIHAIGAVLAEQLHALQSRGKNTAGNQAYYSRLRKLTAKRWLKGSW